jgi:hypothetical protein
MHRELMEIAAVLTRVLRGGEVSVAELMDLSIVTECELRAALLDAHVSLLEFAQHRDMRSRDAAADRAMRARLETCLERIIDAGERIAPASKPSATIH